MSPYFPDNKTTAVVVVVHWGYRHPPRHIASPGYVIQLFWVSLGLSWGHGHLSFEYLAQRIIPQHHSNLLVVSCYRPHLIFLDKIILSSLNGGSTSKPRSLMRRRIVRNHSSTLEDILCSTKDIKLTIKFCSMKFELTYIREGCQLDPKNHNKLYGYLSILWPGCLWVDRRS